MEIEDLLYSNNQLTIENMSLIEENKQLKEINEQHRILNGELRTTINKAIEYITSKEYFFLNNQKTESLCEDVINYLEARDKLLEILGDSNE